MGKYTTLHRFADKEGLERVITPDNSKLGCLMLSRILISAGNTFEHTAKGEEMAIVLIGGDFTAAVEYKGRVFLESISSNRKSVFDELPTAIYIPPEAKIIMESKKGLEARVFSAPAEEGDRPYFIGPDNIEERTPGSSNWRRKYRWIMGPEGKQNSHISKKILVGESVSMPGGWIGWPAHKHDLTTQEEYPLDEIFTFKVKSPQGGYIISHTFSIEPKWDEFYAIDGDNYAIGINEGFHTSMAVPGCTEYLLWGLAGETKTYKLVFDPRFDWMNDAEYSKGKAAR